MRRQHLVSEPSALGSCGGGAGGDDAARATARWIPCKMEAGGARRAGCGAMSPAAGCGVRLLGGGGRCVRQDGVVIDVQRASSTSRGDRGVMLRRQGDGGVMPLKPTMVSAAAA